MGLKRSATCDTEESEGDQVMDNVDNHNDDDASDDDDEDTTMAGSTGGDDGKSLTPIQLKKDMRLRSGRRKRRRSFETSGLTPPSGSKRSRKSLAKAIKSTKKAKAKTNETPINGDMKQTSIAFADSPVEASNNSTQLNVNGSGEGSGSEVVDAAGNNLKSASTAISPSMGPDPRRISYSGAFLHNMPDADAGRNHSAANGNNRQELDIIPPKSFDERNKSSLDEEGSQELDIAPPKYAGNGLRDLDDVSQKTIDEGNKMSLGGKESQELDVTPQEYIARTNGTSRNDSKAVIMEKSMTQVEAVTAGQFQPRNEEAEEEEVVDEPLRKQANKSSSTSTGASTLLRLAIFVALGYISLLFSLPQVIRLTHSVFPLDDSVLPHHPQIPKLEPLPDPVDKEDDGDQEEDKEEELFIPSEKLQSWNKKFLEDFEKLDRAKTSYSSSAQVLEDHHETLLGRVEEIEARFNSIEAQIQSRKDRMEDRLKGLNRLEELVNEINMNNIDDLDEEGNVKWDEARTLARLLLGKTAFSTSSIALWNVEEDIDVDCDLRQEVTVDLPEVDGVEDLQPYLSAQHLEEIESALLLRSTMTAEKFISGSVAEDRIRIWAKSRIEEGINNEEDAIEVINSIKDFAQDLSKSTTKIVQKDFEDSPDASDSILSQIIQSRLDVHRADITGVYDHASLKNGAEIIYGGKRGTSKSLIDSLPIFNRILQNSNLRFYGFGPEAALTPTYPPNTPGQCWSFQQTPLKELLKERLLFENDDRVPNDFKRGNFGTLTIRLSKPIIVDSIIIEHPPIHMTDQAESAIRSFRVVGYEDEQASSKAWILGSFEYSLKKNEDKNEFLQSFEAATTVFGKEIPPLHAISLAVDSNYGHEYACLYRFRVHGAEE